jgi:hypothetical protein
MATEAVSGPRAKRTAGVISPGMATGLLLLGLLSLALWRVLSGSEHQAFAKGATPAESYQVTSGKTYSLAVPGGVPALLKHGIQEVGGTSGSTLGLSCQWSVDGSANQVLTIQPESLDTKAETDVASFTSPVTGDLRVTCDGWGRMFIPDADKGSTDASGYFLLLAIVTLTLGGGMALSVGYSASLARAAALEEGDEDESLAGALERDE